jgi:hypothetical protein
MSDKPNEQGSLAELFARDPFSYTTQDIAAIIKYYREARSSFNLGGKAPPTKINLAELGFDQAPKHTVTMEQFKRGGK